MFSTELGPTFSSVLPNARGRIHWGSAYDEHLLLIPMVFLNIAPFLSQYLEVTDVTGHCSCRGLWHVLPFTVCDVMWRTYADVGEVSEGDPLHSPASQPPAPPVGMAGVSLVPLPQPAEPIPSPVAIGAAVTSSAHGDAQTCLSPLQQ